MVLARTRLAEGMTAYAAGDAGTARDRFLSSYLDGFEPVEPLLATRDRKLLVEVEEAMIALRAAAGNGAGTEEVRAKVAAVEALFDRAEATLDNSCDDQDDRKRNSRKH